MNETKKETSAEVDCRHNYFRKINEAVRLNKNAKRAQDGKEKKRENSQKQKGKNAKGENERRTNKRRGGLRREISAQTLAFPITVD